MKKAGFLSLSVLALLALPGGIRADSNTSDAANPYVQVDPDGVPLSVTHPEPSSLTHEQVAALEQEAAKEERDRNWLIIGYEQQVRTHSHDSAEKDHAPNLYLQLTMDKNLSKLAGLEAIETSEPEDGGPALHAAPTPSSPSTTALRPETPKASGAFTPLVGPLSPFSATATQSFSIPIYSTSIPSILAPSRDGVVSADQPPAPTPAPAPAEHSTSYTEAMDLQTPGMVAAKDNSLGETPDLSLDALPGETGDQARAREAASRPAALPQMMDADQLHQGQALKVKVPSAGNGTNTVSAPAQPQPVTVNPADAPVPVTQQQQISPVRPPNASPYDILNR
jgi:hypothetical protein